MKCTMSPTSAYLTPILRSTTGSLYGAYPGTYNLYLFDPPSPPVWNYCAHMPRYLSVASLLCITMSSSTNYIFTTSCFCEACSRRGINSSSSSFRFQS